MTLDCAETFRLMQDYLDRELSPEEARLVEEHLAGCGICAEEYIFEGSLLRRVSRCLQETDVPADLFERVRASLDSV
jgi:anti-sigma factor (TIGR02949 family)